MIGSDRKELVNYTYQLLKSWSEDPEVNESKEFKEILAAEKGPDTMFTWAFLSNNMEFAEFLYERLELNSKQLFDDILVGRGMLFDFILNECYSPAFKYVINKLEFNHIKKLFEQVLAHYSKAYVTLFINAMAFKAARQLLRSGIAMPQKHPGLPQAKFVILQREMSEFLNSIGFASKDDLSDKIFGDVFDKFINQSAKHLPEFESKYKDSNLGFIAPQVLEFIFSTVELLTIINNRQAVASGESSGLLPSAAVAQLPPPAVVHVPAAEEVKSQGDGNSPVVAEEESSESAPSNSSNRCCTIL